MPSLRGLRLSQSSHQIRASCHVEHPAAAISFEHARTSFVCTFEWWRSSCAGSAVWVRVLGASKAKLRAMAEPT